MALNIKNNFKKGFSKNELLSDLKAVPAAILYVFLPSLFKLKGWLGWAVAVGVPYLAGKALGWYEMSKAALAIGVTHLVYVYGEDTLNSITDGAGTWALGTGNAMADDYSYNSGMYDLASGAQYGNIQGETVMYYPSVAMNDWVTDSQATAALNDWAADTDVNQLLNDDFGANLYSPIYS